jgi:hypothetical protein
MKRLIYLLPLLFFPTLKGADLATAQQHEQIAIPSGGLKVSECSTEHILELGRKSDQKSLKLLHSRFGSGCGAERDYRMALAHRGDKRQQQILFCSNTVVPASPNAWGEIAYVGGWLGIRSALALIETDDAYREYERTHSSDLRGVQGTPKLWGVLALQELIEAPMEKVNEKSSEESLDSVVREWKKWIAAHEKTLRRRTPRGAKVKFEKNACNGLSWKP